MNRNLTCPFCNKTFKTTNKLWEHTVFDHEELQTGVKTVEVDEELYKQVKDWLKLNVEDRKKLKRIKRKVKGKSLPKQLEKEVDDIIIKLKNKVV